MKIDEITELTNILISNMQLKNKYVNSEQKLLLVEGDTDVAFINRIRNTYVDCYTARKIFEVRDVLLGKKRNYKEAIFNIINGSFLLKDKKLENWQLFGLIDSDNEDFNCPMSDRLFITDTHDLETLLLSTDRDVISRLNECHISQDDLAIAVYVTYQFEYILAIISKYSHLDLNQVKCGSTQVNFSNFVVDNKVDVYKLINYLKNTNDISNKDVDSLKKNIITCKELKSKIDKFGIWKQDIITFLTNIPQDLWKVSNGHTILQLIRYYNNNAKEAFPNPHNNKLYRDFEFAIINAYNCEKLRKTKLFNQMNKHNLLKDNLGDIL